MARRIVWTKQAQRERKEILAFWIEHNQSKTYSKKLNRIFISWIRLLAQRPTIGRKTDIPNVRVKTLRDYLVFYQVDDEALYVLSIWDARRDPNSISVDEKV